MDKPLSILLVEDDPDTCSAFSDYFATRTDVVLAGVTDSADRALTFVRERCPNAIILDLELHRGSGNGLWFLSEMATLGLVVKPYVLVTTNNSSAVTYEHARRSGADFILSKQQADYSPRMVVDFLRMIRPTVLNRQEEPTLQQTPEAPTQQKQRLSARICEELNAVGINPKAVGYAYLADGIRLVMQQPVSNLCSEIAAQHKKTDSSVERAMQNAINRAWRTMPIEDLLTHYTARIRSDRGVPTVTEFVYYYANKIKNEY